MTNSFFAKNAHPVWAFLFLSALMCSIGFMHGHHAIGALSISSIFLLYLIFSTGQTADRYGPLLIIFLVLFFYALAFSQFKARSAIMSLQILASFLLFCSLNDLRINAFETNNTKAKFKHYLQLVVITGAMVQSAALIWSYLLSIERGTGLFLDYSQASFFILLCFGLCYSKLKPNLVSALFITFLFVGFFIPFSRTSNFLLLVLLALVSLYEVRSGNTKRFLLVCTTIVLACAFVYLYPLTLQETAVDRGGLSQLSGLNSRFSYWQYAIDAIQQAPLLGHGLGNFEFQGAKAARPFELIVWAHNDYLQVWIDLGLFWLIAFVGAVAWMFFKNFPDLRTIGKIPSDFDHYIAWCLFSCMLMYMMMNFIVFALPFQLLFVLIAMQLISHEQN